MTKRQHGRKAASRRLPSLIELLNEDQARVLKILNDYGVYFDAGTFITMTAPLEKVAAYHAVPNRKAFIAELLKRRAKERR